MPSPELAAHPQVIATPHIGGLTPPAAEHQALETVAQLAALLRGEMPAGAVNAAQATRLAAWRALQHERTVMNSTMGSEVRVPFQPSARYPDPAIEVLDPAFLKLRLFSASVEQLASGCRWAEGPQWFGDGRFLLFSDIPNNRILRWDECSGSDRRVPRALQQRQRPGARPAGPAAGLRAPDAARDAHRVRRLASPCWPTTSRASG